MEIAITILKVLGVIYLSFGIGFLLNPDYYHGAFSKFINKPESVLLSAFLALIAGISLLNIKSTFSYDLTMTIPIIGWIATIKGIALIVIPKLSTSYNTFFNGKKSNLKILAFALLLIGGTFTYFGFFS
jgi:hypothetical protein